MCLSLQVILGLPYDVPSAADMWSLGCVLFELYTSHVLFSIRALPVVLAKMEATLGPVPIDMLIEGQYTKKFYRVGVTSLPTLFPAPPFKPKPKVKQRIGNPEVNGNDEVEEEDEGEEEEVEEAGELCLHFQLYQRRKMTRMNEEWTALDGTTGPAGLEEDLDEDAMCEETYLVPKPTSLLARVMRTAQRQYLESLPETYETKEQEADKLLKVQEKEAKKTKRLIEKQIRQMSRGTESGTYDEEEEDDWSDEDDHDFDDEDEDEDDEKDANQSTFDLPLELTIEGALRTCPIRDWPGSCPSMRPVDSDTPDVIREFIKARERTAPGLYCTSNPTDREPSQPSPLHPRVAELQRIDPADPRLPRPRFFGDHHPHRLQPHDSPALFANFLSQLLRYRPSERPSPEQALMHPFLWPVDDDEEWGL